ncbi:MAG: WYL domain-containing protein [Verrucomicrobia bacterium]|nr:WYL domain-containing protein [Verrucomicrobiota bacterium]
MLRIHQAIQAGQFPNTTTLGRQLEVSSKTVQRDLEFMRDRLELPLEYHPQRFGYHYTEEVNAFPTLQLTEGELFALLVAEKALQQYRGTHFERPLISALKKMEQSLPETMSINLTELSEAISFRTRAEPILNLEVFDALARAVARREQLDIEYRKPGQTQPETRRVDPCHLGNINGEWFLFGYDHLRRDIRTFVPARIRSVRATGEQFKRPPGFSLEQRLKDSFGVHSGAGRFDVVIRFTPEVADYIREKRWHDSQELRELRGGGVELQLRLSSLGEVERWILSWGGRATVVRPRELSENVKRAAQAILKGSRF